MDFLGLSLRAAASGRNDFAPYGFNGDWSDADRAIVEAAITPHVPAAVDSMFNNWTFSYYGNNFIATRATWDRGALFDATAQGLAEKLTEYYGRLK